MGVTISTHNGSAVRREHNIRNEKVVSKEPHIDPTGIHETWIDEPIRKAYDRLFGAAVEEYNSKQTRPERRIKNYYNDICKDRKKHPVYEMIIGIYGKNENGSPICSVEQGKGIMRKFVEEWQERNPNLELIGAYYHGDEPGAEPHVHLDYIPVAHGYTKGIETQTGLVKALGEQGFEKMGKATAQIQWEKHENNFLTSLCEAMGLTVDHPKIEGRKHIDTQELKLQSRIEELERAAEQETKRFLDADDKATEAEIRAATAEKKATNAESRATNAEERAAIAEQKRQEANAQYDEVNKGFKNILDKKARASEIHKIGNLFGETQTYHKNMLKSTRAIGSEAYNYFNKANETMQKAISIQQKVKRKEQSIEPLYQKAKVAYQQAEQERKRAKELREQQEMIIEEQVDVKVTEKVKQIMQGTPTKERDRMRRYMDSLQFNDGTTALERFEEQEQQLHQKLNRDLQR